MAIPTTRTFEAGEITIDYAKCNGCGLCAEVCADNEFKIVNGKAELSGAPVFECIACGHCMAICPEGAIQINGRTLSPLDIIPFSESTKTNYPGFLSLLQRRRSVREFTSQDVSQDIADKIIEAALTAPMGIPPSDVNVLVINDRSKNHQFAKDFCNFLKSQQWLVSEWFITLMRPFWGKTNDKLFRKFLRPLFNVYTEAMAKGKNVVTYDAPLTLYFYGSPYCDPADPLIAATYAMLAAESLGLGTCMIGGVHPFLQNGKAAEKFRKEHGIRYKSREGLFIVAGYPKFKYKKAIRRTFANIDYL